MKTTRSRCNYSPNTTLPPDHHGDYPCTCGLPKRNGRHDEPKPMTADERALDQRRLGESETR